MKPFTVTVLLLILAAGTCVLGAEIPREISANDRQVELLPLPNYPLDEMEEGVRELFEERYAALSAASSGETPDPVRLTDAFAELGRLSMSYERHREAEVCWRNTAALSPDDFRWPYFLGTLLQKLRQNDEAVGFLERVLELEDAYPPALLRLGEIHLLRQDPERAHAFFTSALGAGGGYEAAARYGLGQAAAALGDTAKAIEHYRAALIAQPGADALHHSLGLAYRDLGELDQAREHLGRSGQQKPLFPDALIQSLVAKGAVASMRRGLMAERRGDLAEAVKHHRQAVESDPDNPSLRRKLASIYLALGDHDAAIAAYEETLKLVPKSPLVHVSLAYTLAQRDGLSDSAVDYARRALELAPDYADAHVILGQQAELRGDNAAARAAFEAALAVDPLHVNARQGRARLRALGGETEAATAELEALHRDHPERVEVILDLMTLLARDGKVEQAAARLEDALDADLEPSGRALVLFNLGNLLLQQGRDDDALVRYGQASEIEPTYGDAHFNRASLLLRAGRTAEAASAFARVLELDPDDERARLGRSQALLGAGRVKDARDLLESGAARPGAGIALVHALARLLATAADGEVRDGTRALDLARRVLQAEPKPEYAETVAMALAETGNFDKAAQWQRGILEQARKARAPEAFLKRLETRLELYLRKEPYRAN